MEMIAEKKKKRALCDDMVKLILQRLPVKSVLRFKTVRKSWKDIISDYEFAKSHHLQQQLKKNSSECVIYHDLFFWQSSFMSNRYYHLVRLENGKLKVGALQELHPLIGRNSPPLCSADGLLLSRVSDSTSSYLLWNPRTKQQTIISHHKSLLGDKTTFGFCRGPDLDDYKIVARCSGYYAVYSCKNKSWTERKAFPFPSDTNHFIAGGLFVCGFSFWITYRTPYNPIHINTYILYFDPRYETFKKLPFPEKINVRANINLTSLGGCLCLHENLHGDAQLRILILRSSNLVVSDNYSSVNNSWSEFMIIKDVFGDFIRPLFLAGKNKLVMSLTLLSGKGVYGIYDSTENKFEKLDNADVVLKGCFTVNVPILDSLFCPA